MCYFFDTNVIVSYVFSEYEKTGIHATYLLNSLDDKYIGDTVQEEAFDEHKGKCPQFKEPIFKELQELSYNIFVYGKEYAIENISSDKIRTFAIQIEDEPDFLQRVKQAERAYRAIYIQRLKYIKNNLKCIKKAASTSPGNKKIHDQIIEIMKNTPNKPNWKDIEIFIEAHDASLIYSGLRFVTADFKDILIHKDELLRCAGICEIISLSKRFTPPDS